jgi:hypothetical protein
VCLYPSCPALAGLDGPPNWTLNTDQANRQYNQRIAGESRTAQVGFRVTF